MRRATRFPHAFTVTLVVSYLAGPTLGADPLSAWNETPHKEAIVAFVNRVTDEGSTDFVVPARRIAVFDNDGTLWSEKPVYFQLLFAIDRVKALASEHPEWKTTQPFQAVLENDLDALIASGKQGLSELVMASHAGMTTDEFSETVREWLNTARHPKFNRPYTEVVFQPMLQLLEYLRANGFKTYIVSGGGIEFMRVFAEDVYGIPPEQVLGSSIKTEYQVRDGTPVLVRLPEINFVDDKSGKPVGINQHIAQRPIFAAGNSDGDFEMLEWTTTGPGARFGLLVHHDDADREWAYDRDSHIGQLQRGLDESTKRGWTVISMKSDWKSVYPDKSLGSTRE